MEAQCIACGFTEDERDRVGSLYWEAFGRKLRPAFADDTTGFAVVRVLAAVYGFDRHTTMECRTGA